MSSQQFACHFRMAEGGHFLTDKIDGELPPSKPASSEKSLRHDTLRGGFVYFVARVGLQAFQWLSTLFVARLLLPEDYGLMAVGSMVVELGAILTATGFGVAIIRTPNTTREQEGQLFTISLALAAITYAAVWFAIPAIAAYLSKPELIPFLRVIALVIWLMPINTLAGATLERDLKLSTLAAIHVAMGVGQTVVVLTLAFAGYGVWALGAGVLCGWLIQTAALCWQSGCRPHLAWPNAQSKALVRFGLTVALTSLIWFIHSSADKVVIATALGSTSLGLYSLAFLFAAFPVDRITSSINKIAFPIYGRLQSDPARLGEWYLRLVTVLFATTAPALLGAALVADDIIPLLLGEKWRGLILPFQILAPAGAFMAIAATLSPLLNALGRPDIQMKYEMTCAVVYPITFLAAAQLYGLLGVCAVWLIVYPIQTVGIIHAARHATGISVFQLLFRFAPFLKALGAMIVAVLLVRWGTVHLNAMVRALLSVIAGASVYVGAAVLFMGRDAVLGIVGFMRDLTKGRASD